MQWTIQHVTSSPHFPHGNAHVEKAVHIVKQIYEKAVDVKLALLLLKTMPISNKTGTIYDAPATMFYCRQLKTHVPIRCGYQLQATEDENGGIPDIPSKYHEGQAVWVKLDPHTKWMQGKVQQVLPNKSYNVCLTDGHIFRCNEHHIISQQPSQPEANRNKMMSTADQTECRQHSYILRQRKS